MALFVCGATTRHYTYHNLTRESRRAATTLFLTLASLSETCLTTLLGAALVDYITLLPLVRAAPPPSR